MQPDDSTLADLALAQVPLPENSKYEMLLFHAQQAVEKSLKALLIIHGVDVPQGS
jgi:HEPN domain-containing protein